MYKEDNLREVGHKAVKKLWNHQYSCNLKYGLEVI